MNDGQPAKLFKVRHGSSKLSCNPRPDPDVAAAHDGISRAGVACTSCKTTTPGCCYKIASCTIGEALQILIALGPQVLTRASEFIAAAKVELTFSERLLNNASEVLSGKVSMEEHEKFSAAAHMDHFNGQHPCVLLSPEGKCSAYAVRPLVCSLFVLAEGEDPSVCAHREDGKSVVIKTYEIESHEQRIQDGRAFEITFAGKKMTAPRVVYMGVATALCVALLVLTKNGVCAPPEAIIAGLVKIDSLALPMQY